MKVSQIVALSATLAVQAHACVRVRVDRWVHENLGTIQAMALYDNDNPVKTLPSPINFSAADDETSLSLDGYRVTLQYKDRKLHPYGGRISYPEGCKSATVPRPLITQRIPLMAKTSGS
jgi:hypothetical protein